MMWIYIYKSAEHISYKIIFRLLESTYTIDEIEDVWNDLRSIVSTDVESELIACSHTNVLLLKQVFEQAQKWHLNLDADLAELENR